MRFVKTSSKGEQNTTKCHHEHSFSHRSREKSRDVKKCKAKLKAPWKSAHQELRNEPPHDIGVRLPKKSFSGQPMDRVWIRGSRGWPERDFGGNRTAMSCGASFRSSWCADFHGAFCFALNFFMSMDFPLEWCVKWGLVSKLLMSWFLVCT